MGFVGISNLMVLGGIYVAVAVIFWILQIIANWKIFTKANQAGWKSIIPVYSDHIAYKIAWKPIFFWIAFVLEIIAPTLETYAKQGSGNSMLLVVATLLKIVVGIITFLYYLKLSKAFGKGIGFSIGLFLLSPIFTLILAFSDCEYIGADQPLK